MASLCLVTPRDRDLVQALDRCPLTVRQILKLSDTFSYPFTYERRVQERLQCLAAAGRVRRWRYATAGQGALSYFKLTPVGYRLLHGPDAMPSGRNLFRPVGIAREAHTRALAEVIVHLAVGAYRAGIAIENFCRENTVRLRVGEDNLYPDAAFELSPDAVSRFRFLVEIDNCSETVGPGAGLNTWARKVQFYERYQDTEPERFRVLVITTGRPARLAHMLHCSQQFAHNPQRSLIYGIRLNDLLSVEDPLFVPCFANHVGKPAALLAQVRLTSPPTCFDEAPVLDSAACLRSMSEV
jgi:hypothetical protein